MKITYDKIADAAYVYFKKIKKVSRTVPINNDIIIDFGSKGEVLGIEILNASSHIPLHDLRGIKLQMLPA